MFLNGSNDYKNDFNTNKSGVQKTFKMGQTTTKMIIIRKTH